MSDSQQINRVKIEFTDKPLTAWSGLATLMGKFLDKINFWDWVEESIIVEEKSNSWWLVSIEIGCWF